MANILVVDDEEFIIDIIKEIVEEEMGHVVKVAFDGETGLAMAKEEKFDLIISDFHMPVMNGAQFINGIRSGEGPNKQAPVMFVSAFSDPVRNQMEGQEGIYFLEKPIIISKLIAGITEILGA